MMRSLYMGEMNNAIDEPNVSVEPPEDMQNKEPRREPDILHDLRMRYASSFTMHALNHIQDGRVLEKIVWIVKLLCLFAAAIFICWGLFTGFLSHEVNTTIKTSMKTSLNFPKMYLCTNINDQMAGGMQSPNYVEVGPPAQDPDKPDTVVHPPGTQLIPRGWCGSGWQCSKPTHFGHCIVLNDVGTLEQKPGKYTNEPGIRAYGYTPMNIKHPLELWISSGEWKWGQGVHREMIPRAGIYSFKLSKTIYHRLPAPYTDCVVDGSDRDLSYSLFKGQYSFEKCARTCQIRAELEECGFIRNENTIYMRNKEYKKPLANYTDKAYWYGNCTKWFVKSNKEFKQRIDECIAKCPAPCEETRYDVSVSYNEGLWNTFGPSGTTYLDKDILRLDLEFKDFIIMEIGQQPAYELTALIANFGGTLGLMCGMSAVSILELIIWLFLSVALAVFQLYKKVT